ncbi:TadE/TadG family type IV pilus assembly protein [Nocardioides sp.]|uniref:TadE/TadG family type IV pilus assembly protein n=1 Tax=Nocardioides sp. TaxID=35761 RepID=UPI0035631848
MEFALTLPLLLILVLGIIQYGLYFAARQGGSDISRDAARRAAVGESADCASFRAAVKSNIGGVVGASPDDAVITRSYTRADPALVQVGDTVTVKVAFDSHDLHVPFVPTPGNARVETTVIARVEYVPTQPETCG